MRIKCVFVDERTKYLASKEPKMALSALDYTKVIADDLKSIPESYLPIVANLIHSFK